MDGADFRGKEIDPIGDNPLDPCPPRSSLVLNCWE